MDQNYTTTFAVDQTSEEASRPSIMFVDGGQERFEGGAGKPGAEFTYHYEDVHRAQQKVTEFVPNKKVVWHGARTTTLAL